MHHALLLLGPAGIGKSSFAMALAARLLCERVSSATALACGACPACHWFETSNHPDFRLITLESDADEGTEETAPAPKGKKGAGKGTTARATQIKIDQIRALDDFAAIGSHRHGNRVIVVDPVDALNTAAANSILKLLEEPPLNTYFILVSSHPRKLIPTLRSRCNTFLFGLPERSVAARWLADQGVAKPETELALTGGTPLNVLGSGALRELAECVVAPLLRPPVEALTLAGQWDAALRSQPGLTPERLVEILQKWVHDLICRKLAQPPRYLDSLGKNQEAIAQAATLSRLLRVQGDLLKIRATARHPLNPQLFLEDLAYRYTAAVAGGR